MEEGKTASLIPYYTSKSPRVAESPKSRFNGSSASIPASNHRSIIMIEHDTYGLGPEPDPVAVLQARIDALLEAAKPFAEIGAALNRTHPYSDFYTKDTQIMMEGPGRIVAGDLRRMAEVVGSIPVRVGAVDDAVEKASS
jgi:hypothetical protein